jgi:hypothetical protein
VPFIITLVNLASKGLVKGKSLLLASRLVLFIKDDGGVRPIAISSLIYRVAAKAVLRTLDLDDALLLY